MFEIRAGEKGVVHVSGRLDAARAEDALGRLNGFEGPMTLDCSGLEYISSAGLSVLLVTYKRLRSSGHPFKVVNLQPNVRNVLVYAGFHRLLEIE